MNSTRVLVTLVAIFTLSGFASAEVVSQLGEPNWTYSLAVNPPPLGSGLSFAVVPAQHLDSAGNALLVVPFSGGANGTRVIWITPRGKTRYSTDVAPPFVTVSVVSMSPTTVILRLSGGGNTVLRKLKLKSSGNAVTVTDSQVPVGFLPVPNTLPSSRGFILSNFSSIELIGQLEFRYYR
jgi:hypothetical protein